MSQKVAVRRVVVVGAGAMGCLFAARMLEAGAEVTLVEVKPERVKLLLNLGLLLSDDYGERLLRPRIVTADALSGSVDLIMLFTKGIHSAAAVASVSHLARCHPFAITLQNGIGNAELLAETFGGDRVLMGTAHVAADLEPPNRVVTHGFAKLSIGGYSNGAHPAAHAIAELLTRSRFKPAVTENIEQEVWTKLAFNCALNPLAMITCFTNGEMDTDAGKQIAYQVVREVIAVADAKGLRLDCDSICRTIDLALSKHPLHKASMLQDREQGRPTEIESINGAVVRQGGRLGVATPVNSTLADLVRLIGCRERNGPPA